MARGKGVVHSTSSRGGSSSTTNQLHVASPINSRVSNDHISRSTSATGGYLNTSNRQPLSPLAHRAPATSISPRVPTAPTVPRVPAAPTAPRIPAVPIVPRVPIAPQAPRVPVIPIVPHVLEVPVAPIVPAAHVPIAPNDPAAPPIHHPRNTRGLTTGVKAPKAGQMKILVTVLRHKLLPETARSKIGEIFRRHFNELRTKWSHWRGELNDMWADYLRYFRFATPQEDKRGRIVWEHLAAKNFPNYLYGWKTNAIKAYGTIEVARNHTPEWTNSDAWKALCDWWLSPEFNHASELRKKNRSSIKNIPHTTGRVPFEEIDLKLHDKLGRVPTPIERFTETHIRKNKSTENNEMIWIDHDAEMLEEAYANELRAVNGLDPTVLVNAILNPGCDAVSDPGCTTWQVVAGGVKKGRLLNRPGEKFSQRSGCASSVDYAAYVSLENSIEEIKGLKEDLNAMKKKSDEDSKENKVLKAYFNTMAPMWAEMAKICGMGSCPPPPLFINASPTMESPFDGDGENDDEIP